jgi:Flp pilus assembly protein TadG
MTEFAVTASLMLLLMFGVIDFGRALFDYNQVAQAARVGARYAMVDTPVPYPSNNCATAGASCQTAIISYLETKTGIATSRLVPSPTVSFGPAATVCATQPVANGLCTVRVTLNYQFQFILLPFLGQKTFTASSQEVLASQYCATETSNPCPVVTP